MPPAKRIAARREWPEYLREPRPGYFTFDNPLTGKSIVIGRVHLTEAKKQARAANLWIAQQRERGSLVDKLARPDVTLGNWLGTFITLADRDATAVERPPSPKTIKNRKSLLTRAVAELGADTALRDVTTKHVAELLRRMHDHKHYAQAVKVRSFLFQAFTRAEAEGMIERGTNPVELTKSPTAKTKRARLTLETFAAIYEAAKGFDPWLRNAMLLALVTAQRREDIAAATFKAPKDQSMGPAMWLDGDWLMVIQGKTGARLRISTALALDLPFVGGRVSIASAVIQCHDRVLSRHIVHHTKRYPHCPAGSPVRVDLLSQRFAEARDLSGLTWEGKEPPTFHEIRSLSERIYSEQGVVDTQHLLGHKSAAMTAVYNDARGAEFKTVRVK